MIIQHYRKACFRAAKQSQAVKAGLLYAVVYLILSAGELALLMGSVLAFLTVSATMWGARHEDWGAALGVLKLRGRGRVPEG